MIPGLARGRIPGSTATVRCVLQDFPVADISEHLADAGSVVWLDLCRPTPADFDMIGEEFGLHELAVEDALHESQRPKLDRYATHLFLSAYAVDLDARAPALDDQRDRGVHHRPGAGHGTQGRRVRHRRRRRALGRPRPTWPKHGVGFLLYGLLDLVVDGHFDAVQQLDDEIEELEDLLFDERPRRSRRSSAAASSCARAWSCCAGWCCRCARSSTR